LEFGLSRLRRPLRPSRSKDLTVWKWLLGIGILLLLSCAGGAFWAYNSGKIQEWREKFDPSAKVTEVRTEKVIKGDLVRTVSAPGQIEPDIKVQISSQVSARITELPFKGGELVKKGTLVVRMDDRDLKAALDQARADLTGEQARRDGAMATLANATIDLGRKRELFSTNDIAKMVLDQAEADYLRAAANVKSSEAGIEAAQARIRRAERDLENCTVYAPFDGTVTKVSAEVGELVLVGTMNNAASVIMEIADLSNMLMKARVDESNISPITLDQSSKIFINAFPNREFAGKVRRIIPQRQVERDGTAYFEVEIAVTIPDGVALKQGLTANADIAVQTLKDVIKVPSQAIVDRAIDELPKAVVDGSPHIDRGKKFARVVYMLESTGKVKSLPVAVGASDLTTTVILAGLKDDDQIITGPAKVLIAIKDGQTARIMSDKKPADGGKSDPQSLKPDEPAKPN
jgi:HlyD family secretion protein